MILSRELTRLGPAANLGLRKIIIERRNVPEILASGLITPAEVDKLFNIFFDKMNVSVTLHAILPNVTDPSIAFRFDPR